MYLENAMQHPQQQQQHPTPTKIKNKNETPRSKTNLG
jgi:hypothetical protein